MVSRGGVSEDLFLSCVLCLHDISLAFAVAAKQSCLMKVFSLKVVGGLESREYQKLQECGHFKIGLSLPPCVIDSKALVPQTFCA